MNQHSVIHYMDPSTGNIEFLSYCVQKPIYVLKEVYKEHRIHQYGDIGQPLDSDFDNFRPVNPYGLIISGTGHPSGATITGDVSSIDFSVAKAELVVQRSVNDKKTAFAYAINEAMSVMLDGFGTFASYLDDYAIIHDHGDEDPIYETRIDQLFEVLRIGFNENNPTIPLLQEYAKYNDR